MYSQLYMYVSRQQRCPSAHNNMITDEKLGSLFHDIAYQLFKCIAPLVWLLSLKWWKSYLTNVNLKPTGNPQRFSAGSSFSK